MSVSVSESSEECGSHLSHLMSVAVIELSDEWQSLSYPMTVALIESSNECGTH